MRETQRKGDTAVAQAIATFTRLGYDVSVPLTESAAYDLVVDDGVRLYRMQVRYTSRREVGLRRIHSNSKGYVVKRTEVDAYDWLYVYRSDGTEYLIKRCLAGRNAITPTAEHLLSQQCLALGLDAVDSSQATEEANGSPATKAAIGPLQK